MDDPTHITEIIEDNNISVRSNFRFIKLANGEDVVGEMLPDSSGTGYIIVRDPMKVTMVLRQDGGASFGFSNWIPFTSQRCIAINKVSIVSLADLNNESEMLYLKCRESIENSAREIIEEPDISDAFQVQSKWIN